MGELTDRTPAELQKELGPLIYRNPNGLAWEAQDEYLSGNGRAKLVLAREGAKADPAFDRVAGEVEAEITYSEVMQGRL